MYESLTDIQCNWCDSIGIDINIIVFDFWSIFADKLFVRRVDDYVIRLINVYHTYITQKLDVGLSHGMAITDIGPNHFSERLLVSLQTNNKYEYMNQTGNQRAHSTVNWINSRQCHANIFQTTTGSINASASLITSMFQCLSYQMGNPSTIFCDCLFNW